VTNPVLPTWVSVHLPVLGRVRGDRGDRDVAGFVGPDLSCGGRDEDLVIGVTNPATRIFRFSGTTAGCALGDDGSLGIDIFGDTVFGFVAIGGDADTPPTLVAEGELESSDSSISGDLTVVEPPTDPEEVVSVGLTVGPVVDRGTFRFKTRSGAFSERFVDNLLTVVVTPS
jgi:hypothetical protein